MPLQQLQPVPMSLCVSPLVTYTPHDVPSAPSPLSLVVDPAAADSLATDAVLLSSSCSSSMILGRCCGLQRVRSITPTDLTAAAADAASPSSALHTPAQLLLHQCPRPHVHFSHTLVLAMAYTSAEFELRTRGRVPTHVTSSLLRDRWRLELEQSTKLRVTSFNQSASPSQCMPGQHICGTFGSRATAALSDHLQQQGLDHAAHAHFDRVYLDYVRLPRGYIEQAYECVPSILSMLTRGLVPLHGEVVLPLYVGLGESLAQAFVNVV
jgi:hypothetical protein